MSRTSPLRTAARSLVASVIIPATLLVAQVPVVAATRPSSPAPGSAVSWTAPAPLVNSAVATVDGVVYGFASASNSFQPQGAGVYLPVVGSAPLTVSLEREVVDAYGSAGLTAAIEQFNGTASSRFRVVVEATTTSGVHGPVVDGVNRVFFDDATCGGSDLAWSHITEVGYDHAYGTGSLPVTEFEIGLCRRLQPADLASSIGHELLHVAGMGHLCNRGETCWRAGMDNDNSCRLLYPSAKSCQTFSELDEKALAYLHPAVPRLSGPGRTETAARVSYAGNPGSRTTSDVVLVDGDRGPDLAIQAAALAAVRQAPLLLVSSGRRCTEGSWGTELNRVAADGATVWLVGPLHAECNAELTNWGLNVREVADATEVATAIAGASAAPTSSAPSSSGPTSTTGGLLGGGDQPAPSSSSPPAPPVGTILITRGAVGGESPDALAAAAVAGRLDAPVLYSQGGALAPETARWLDSRGSAVPERALVVGGVNAVPASVVDQLKAYGIAVERIAGSSRIETALELARLDEAFGGSRGRLLIAAADRWADTVAASAQGGAKGWPVVLVWKDEVPASVKAYMSETSAAAVIVGGPGVVSDASQYELSRAVKRLP